MILVYISSSNLGGGIAGGKGTHEFEDLRKLGAASLLDFSPVALRVQVSDTCIMRD